MFSGRGNISTISVFSRKGGCPFRETTTGETEVLSIWWKQERCSAKAYAAPGSEVMMNDVAAVEDSAVLFFNVKKILTTCSSACRFHSLVVQNLFFAISEKNRKLMRKLTHMSKRTTREKLLSYLSDEAKRQGRSSFEIPFNRQQLADFLSVDRSAMSSELGKMRDEGILTFQKNRFTLL